MNAQGGAEYGVRVFAFNPSGYSESSEVATFRWEHPRGPGPVTGVSVRAIGPTAVRVAWTAEPEAGRYQVGAVLRGWRDQRSWRSGSQNVSAGTAWMDFEGLPRGGRYAFVIVAVKGPPTSPGVPSFAYLTLGERGAGPRAPSDLDWVLEGNRVRLSWKDNSSDELGFEVQVSRYRGTFVRGIQRLAEAAHGPRGHGIGRLLRRIPLSDPKALPGLRLQRPRLLQGVGAQRFLPGGCGDALPAGLALPGEGELVEGRRRVGRRPGRRGGHRRLGHVPVLRSPATGRSWSRCWTVAATNGRMWVLGASTTDLGYRIRGHRHDHRGVAVVHERARPAGAGDRRYGGLLRALPRRRRALAATAPLHLHGCGCTLRFLAPGCSIRSHARQEFGLS